MNIVFMGFINQHSHHWGAPSCTSPLHTFHSPCHAASPGKVKSSSWRYRDVQVAKTPRAAAAPCAATWNRAWWITTGFARTIRGRKVGFDLTWFFLTYDHSILTCCLTPYMKYFLTFHLTYILTCYLAFYVLEIYYLEIQTPNYWEF